MSGNTTANSDAIIRGQVYSELLLEAIEGGYLPEGIARDVSDFGDGDTLNIPVLGDVVLRDLQEDVDTPIDAIDTGNVTLQITDHKGAGSYLTDKLKQDSYKAAQVEASIVPSHLRALRKAYETSLLATANHQTAADPNEINGFARRYVASGTNQTLTIDDLIYAKAAFDEGEVPDEGRIMIVSSLSEASLNSISNIVQVSNNPLFEGIVNTGFAKNMRFLKNIMGFDIYISSRLPRVTAETVDTTTGGSLIAAPSGSDTVANGIVNVAACVLDDTVTPFMSAWRQQPMTEGVRNVRKRRDEFYTTGRWGHGIQRFQTLLTVLTNATAYK